MEVQGGFFVLRNRNWSPPEAHGALGWRASVSARAPRRGRRLVPLREMTNHELWSGGKWEPHSFKARISISIFCSAELMYVANHTARPLRASSRSLAGGPTVTLCACMCVCVFHTDGINPTVAESKAERQACCAKRNTFSNVFIYLFFLTNLLLNQRMLPGYYFNEHFFFMETHKDDSKGSVSYLLRSQPVNLIERRIHASFFSL